MQKTVNNIEQSQLSFKEAQAHNIKLQQHVDNINRLTGILCRGGAKVVVEVSIDDHAASETKVPKIKIESTFAL